MAPRRSPRPRTREVQAVHPSPPVRGGSARVVQDLDVRSQDRDARLLEVTAAVAEVLAGPTSVVLDHVMVARAVSPSSTRTPSRHAARALRDSPDAERPRGGLHRDQPAQSCRLQQADSHAGGTRSCRRAAASISRRARSTCSRCRSRDGGPRATACPRCVHGGGCTLSAAVGAGPEGPRAAVSRARYVRAALLRELSDPPGRGRPRCCTERVLRPHTTSATSSVSPC